MCFAEMYNSLPNCYCLRDMQALFMPIISPSTHSLKSLNLHVMAIAKQ